MTEDKDIRYIVDEKGVIRQASDEEFEEEGRRYNERILSRKEYVYDILNGCVNFCRPLMNLLIDSGDYHGFQTVQNVLTKISADLYASAGDELRSLTVNQHECQKVLFYARLHGIQITDGMREYLSHGSFDPLTTEETILSQIAISIKEVGDLLKNNKT